MKQEIIYVQITGCGQKNYWYKNDIGNYYPVTKDVDGYGYFMSQDLRAHIEGQDCRRVYLREQETDVDGEPLVCGDEVFNTSGHVICKLKYLYFYNSVYWCENMQGYRIGYDSVRKVKPEPVEEETPHDKVGRWLSAALHDPKVCDEMKQDIKDWFEYLKEQEPPQKGYFEVDEPIDPIEEVWKKWNKTIFAKDSLDYTKMLEHCLDDLSNAIKQHIENKKEQP